MTSLRVVTINILNTDGGWPDRRPLLAQGLADLDADLVALQETVVRPDYDQAADLLPVGYHLIHNANRSEGGEGISIASRWPITAVRDLALAVTERAGRVWVGTLIAEIDAPSPIGRLLFVNHFPSWTVDHERERELQAVAAAGAIEELRADRPIPVILAGDLDADPDAASIRFWSGRQALQGLSVCYLDAWAFIHGAATGDDRGHTFTPRNQLMASGTPGWPYRRIDYIFVRCDPGPGGLLPTRAEVVLDEPVGGVWPSDHFGLLAELMKTDAA